MTPAKERVVSLDGECKEVAALRERCKKLEEELSILLIFFSRNSVSKTYSEFFQKKMFSQNFSEAEH